MRKIWIAGAVAATAAAFTVAGAAFATNTYVVDIASGGPGNPKGSAAKPLAAFLNFGYEEGDTENLRRISRSSIRRQTASARSCGCLERTSRPSCPSVIDRKSVV